MKAIRTLTMLAALLALLGARSRAQGTTLAPEQAAPAQFEASVPAYNPRLGDNPQ